MVVQIRARKSDATGVISRQVCVDVMRGLGLWGGHIRRRPTGLPMRCSVRPVWDHTSVKPPLIDGFGLILETIRKE
jgi:hypothetical protein